MFEFGQKHLNDLFVLDGIVNVSARDTILREIISNSLAHRDYSNAYVAKMLIEKDRIVIENGNRAHGVGALNLQSFQPFPKNPPISKVFREIGYADELGSGMRNSYKYTKMYSGATPEFIEGDVFQIVIPLTVGAMTKVGPTTWPADSGQVGGQVSGQVEQEPVFIHLEPERYEALMSYCEQPRSRAELQSFCGVKSRDYFRNKILLPLLQSGRLTMTIPDKPNSSKQKYLKP